MDCEYNIKIELARFTINLKRNQKHDLGLTKTSLLFTYIKNWNPFIEWIENNAVYLGSSLSNLIHWYVTEWIKTWNVLLNY